ncbi:MAG: SAF domain-containing protein [Pseudomonadota bacterium]
MTRPIPVPHAVRDTDHVKVAISGTGFIARGACAALSAFPQYDVTRVLTRRPVAASAGAFPEEKLTNSIDEFLEDADIVVECSGDAAHAAEVMIAAGEAGRNIVTINSEAQITVGSAMVRRGYSITEAHGDQPGCLAELHEECLDMGFTPLAYINLKGFLNLTPSLEDMQYWGPKQGLSLRQVTSFTDGSKLQVEQAFVANGLGAGIAQQGLIGGSVAELSDLGAHVEAARKLGKPISDYTLNPGGPPGVLVLADCAVADAATDYMPFTRLQTKEGGAYVLLRPHHLVHLELTKTLRRVVEGRPPLLTNSADPTITVAAIAKRPLPAGTVFDEALGGFDLRGEAIEIAGNADAAPITLMDGARLRHAVEPGQVLRMSDVEMVENRALDLYRESLTPQG